MPERPSDTQGTPNWVDLPTSDQAAAKAFYAGLFGWTYDDQPMGEGQVYSMAMLGGHRVHLPFSHGLVVVGPAEQPGVERLGRGLVTGRQVHPVGRPLRV